MRLNVKSATANAKRPAMSHHILRRKGAPDFTRVCSSPVTLQAYHKNDEWPEVIINAARRASNAYAVAGWPDSLARV
jgi:hypothetical protein